VSKRLLLGLTLPASIRQELLALDPRMNGVCWSALEQFHLTMSFLGEVDTQPEERLRETLSSIQVPSCFFLPIVGVGVFGGDWPKVLWVGVGRGHPHLFALHQRLQDAVLHAGLEPDLKPFHPHITLARLRGVSRQVLKPFLRRHTETEFGLWKVGSFALLSSSPSSAGSTYEVELQRDLP
jgi:2'-5' RNA ligase